MEFFGHMEDVDVRDCSQPSEDCGCYSCWIRDPVVRRSRGEGGKRATAIDIPRPIARTSWQI